MSEPDEDQEVPSEPPLSEEFEQKMKEINEFWEKSKAAPVQHYHDSNSFWGRFLSAIRTLH